MDADQVDDPAAAVDLDALVAQRADTERVPQIQPAAAVARVELVVAADPEHAQRGPQIPQRLEVAADLRDGAVDEVAAEQDQLGLLGVDEIDDLAREPDSAGRTDVQVRHEGDAHAGELARQAPQRYPDPLDPGSVGLDDAVARGTDRGDRHRGRRTAQHPRRDGSVGCGRPARRATPDPAPTSINPSTR